MAEQVVKPKIGMSLDEYMRRYDEDGPFEIINGEIVPMSPTSLGHGRKTRKLFRILDRFLADNLDWEVLFETSFIRPDQDVPNWVKGSFVPDIMILRAADMAAYEEKQPDAENRP